MANRKTIPFDLMTRPPRKARVGPAVLGPRQSKQPSRLSMWIAKHICCFFYMRCWKAVFEWAVEGFQGYTWQVNNQKSPFRGRCHGNHME